MEPPRQQKNLSLKFRATATCRVSHYGVVVLVSYLTLDEFAVTSGPPSVTTAIQLTSSDVKYDGN